jgi:hypothetical protein
MDSDQAKFGAARADDGVNYPYRAPVAQFGEKQHRLIHNRRFRMRLNPVEDRGVHFFQFLKITGHIRYPSQFI